MCCDDKSINATSSGIALACLILNIFIPGMGTILNAGVGYRVCPGVLYGILQFLLTPLFLIGWIWSIVYGIRCIQIAERKHSDGYHQHDDHHHHDHHGHGNHH
eukprot:403347084